MSDSDSRRIITVLLVLILSVQATPAIAQTTQFDGTYNYSYQFYGPNGPETHEVPGFFVVQNGVISTSTTPSEFSGTVGADGSASFTGPCPFSSGGADYSGQLGISGSTISGGGNYTCRIGGSGGTWSVTLASSPSSSFDFSISVSPATVTVGRGGAAVYDVSVTLVSGDPQTVTLQSLTSNYPPGFLNTITASFDSTSGTPPFTTTLTVQTSANTPAATVTKIVHGEGGGVTHEASATLVVTEQPSTTEIAPNSTTTQACGDGYHLGGIPNSQNSFICVPNGLRVDEGSDPSVTPVGDGLLIDTKTGSVVDITCPTSTSSCPESPDSAYLGATTWAGVYSTSCGTTTECATAYATYLQKLYGACQANSGCAQAWELATSFNDYQEKITTFLTTATNDGFTSASGNLVVNLVTGWAWQKAYHAVSDGFKILTSNAGVVPVGNGDPELSILAARNGTTVYDWKGQAFVQSFASNQTILMSPGQQLFIPSNQTQASQQNLASSVQSFDPSSINQWWILPQNKTNDYTTYGILFLVVILAVCLLIGFTFVRRRSSKQGMTTMATPATPLSPRPGGPEVATSQPAQRIFCPNCKSPVSGSDLFCDNCGAKLTMSRPCPYCGFGNLEDADFCTNCGKAL